MTRCTTCGSRAPLCPPCASWRRVQERAYDAAAGARTFDFRTLARFLLMTQPHPPFAQIAERALELAARREAA